MKIIVNRINVASGLIEMEETCTRVLRVIFYFNCLLRYITILAVFSNLYLKYIHVCFVSPCKYYYHRHNRQCRHRHDVKFIHFLLIS